MDHRKLALSATALLLILGAVALVALSRSKAGDPATVPLAALSELRARDVLFIEEHDIYLVNTEATPLALSNDAQHVGDIVEFCTSSRMFESAAHGEKFDIRGNYYAGPAARGLARYPVRVVGQQIFVDLDRELPGPDRGAQDALEPKGRFCVPT